MQAHVAQVRTETTLQARAQGRFQRSTRSLQRLLRRAWERTGLGRTVKGRATRHLLAGDSVDGRVGQTVGLLLEGIARLRQLHTRGGRAAARAITSARTACGTTRLPQRRGRAG